MMMSFILSVFPAVLAPNPVTDQHCGAMWERFFSNPTVSSFRRGGDTASDFGPNLVFKDPDSFI